MRPYTSCKTTVHDIIYGNVITNAIEYSKLNEQITLQTLQEKIKNRLKNVFCLLTE